MHLVSHLNVLELDLARQVVAHVPLQDFFHLLWLQISISEKSLYRNKVNLKLESPSDCGIKVSGNFNSHLEANSLDRKFSGGFWISREE